MTKPIKHFEICKLLKRRIESGVYLNQWIPGERAIATEIGVSYMTVRKAIRQLVDEQVLTRKENGRLVASSKVRTHNGQKTYVLITSAFESYANTHARDAIERVLVGRNSVLKTRSYRQWHDPALMSVFDENWDGIFIVPPLDEIPKLLMDRLLANASRLVSLYVDLSKHGIMSVDNSDAVWGNQMVNYLVSLMTQRYQIINHLISLGHQRVDFLNTQYGLTIKERIEAWQAGVTANGIEGCLWDEPTAAYQNNCVKAYWVSKKALASGQMAKAVVCSNISIACGLARAAHELGLKIGKDFVYCTVDAPQEAIFAIPSVTTFNLEPLDRYIQMSCDWLEQGDDTFGNKRLLIPDQAPALLLGESTGTPSMADQTEVNILLEQLK